MEWNLLETQADFLKLLEYQGKSFNTVKNYKADLACFNTFLIQKQEHLKIRTFTSTQVQEYARYLEQKYGSPNSVRRRVQALRLFFDYLVGKDIFTENSIKQMGVSPKILDVPAPTPYNEVLSAYRKLKAKYADSTGLTKFVTARNILIFHLIYDGGLKVSDMAKLHFNSILKSGPNYRVMVEHPKRDPYSIPLPESFNDDYLNYKELYHQHIQDDEISELLFNANPYRILSGGLSPRGTELFFEDLRSEMKTEMTAKSLRQSCIMKWLTQNINHTTIKEWMGVTPGYSLELYVEELRKNPEGLVFGELEGELVS